jgi:hypothetical protein
VSPELVACDALTASSDAAVPLPLRRLNRLELTNTLRELFDGEVMPPAANALPADELGESGFVQGGSVALTDAQRLLQTAERAVNALGNVAALAGCAAGMDDAACAEQFVKNFGRRGFRRPLMPSEVQRYSAYYQKTRSELGASHEKALRLVIEVMLLSPDLLYHRQTGHEPPAATGGTIKLSQHELASRLSYFLWSAPPDAELARAADGGALGTPEALVAQAERLLQSPKARATIEAFHLQWLKVTGLPDMQKSSDAFPEFNDALKRSMLDQIVAFADEAVLKGGGLNALLRGSFAHVDAELAPLYGLNQSGVEMVRVELDATQRSGIFTLPGFIAAQSAGTETLPPRLGSALHRNLLCEELPPVPPEVPPVKPPTPGLTTRERFAEHSTNPCAKACHGTLDPLGFSFEHYDPIGRYRTSEHGEPVDASGSLPMRDGTDIPFRNAVELMAALSERDEVRACVARQWSRFALGRREVAGDSAGFCTALAGFESSGFDIRQLLLALVKARSFTERAPAAGEPVK